MLGPHFKGIKQWGMSGWILKIANSQCEVVRHLPGQEMGAKKKKECESTFSEEEHFTCKFKKFCLFFLLAISLGRYIVLDYWSSDLSIEVQGIYQKTVMDLESCWILICTEDSRLYFVKKNLCCKVTIIRTATHLSELRQKGAGLCHVCVAVPTAVRHWVGTIVCTWRVAPL